MELQLMTNENAPDEEQYPEYELYDMHKGFGELLDAGLFINVHVVSGTVEIPAHKSVLAARVPFFKEALVHDSAGKKTIEIPPEISVDIVKLIIDFAYFKWPKVNLENAQALLEAAAYFRMEDLWGFCDQFVAKRIVLTVQDCLTVQSYARVYSAKLLAEFVVGFIAKHFADVIDTDAFKGLSENEITLFLSTDYVHDLPDESTFWEALVKWIQAGVNDRKALMPELLGLLRLPNLSKDDIILKVLAHPYIDTNPICRRMIHDLLSYKADPSNKELQQRCLASFNFRKRSNSQQIFHHLCIFYSDIFSSKRNVMQVLLSPDGEWTKKCLGTLDEIVGPIVRVVAVGNAVYCFTAEDKLTLYALSSETWTIIEGDEGRPEGLCHLRVCSVGGNVVACGFGNGDYNQTFYYCYDPSTNRWQRQRLYIEKGRYLAGICGVTVNGKNGGNEMLCVLSGCRSGDCNNGLNQKDINLCRVNLFDIHTGSLIQRGKHISFLGSAGISAIASYKEKVFIGTGEGGGMGGVKAYDVIGNEWSSLPNLNVGRRLFDMAIASDRLYAMGGYSLRMQLRLSVEYLDLTDANPQWKYGPQLLDIKNTSMVSSCTATAVC